MIESDINKRYCQSCGMPLRFDIEKYLGTNSTVPEVTNIATTA